MLKLLVTFLVVTCYTLHHIEAHEKRHEEQQVHRIQTSGKDFGRDHILEGTDKERRKSAISPAFKLRTNEDFEKYEGTTDSQDGTLNANTNEWIGDKTSFDEFENDVGDITPISLHNDINVNYIGRRGPFNDDAEDITPTSIHDINANSIGRRGQFNDDSEVKDLVEQERAATTVKTEDYKEKKNYIKKVNHMKRDYFYENMKQVDLLSIPNTNNSALVARYIIHNVDWTAIGTLSANNKMKGGPFVNVISFSDGPLSKGSGIPFFYMTPKDFSSVDLNSDNRCAITATLAQTGFCEKKNIDPESPLCARVILYGKMKKIKNDSKEESFAKEALFSRHPDMENWPKDHNWYFSKLKIKQIILLNHFGGATYISVKDYFNVN